MTELTMETLLEEAKIERIINLYASALDNRDWQALEQVFTPDAVCNYGEVGVFEGRDAIQGLVQHVLGQCGPTQHLLGNVSIRVNGSEAEAHCYLQAIHPGLGDYEGQLLTVWGEYRDKLKRTADGWRITHRELASIHSEGDIGLQ